MSMIISPDQIKYLESFRKKNDSLINEMENYASVHKIPILSWLSAEFMEQIVLLMNPARVLEIGTAIGYTTIRIARCLLDDSVIDTIELSKENIKIAESNFEKSGVSDRIKLLKGNALSIIPKLKSKYDLIFLDADKEDYKKLFDYSMPLLKKGGVFVVDNLLWHGFAASENVPSDYKVSAKFIRDFNKMFMNHQNLITAILPVGDGLGIGIKK